MSLVAFIGAIEVGLIYSLIALSLFMSYRVLNIADLSVDGTFPLGAAVSAIYTLNGHPFLGVILAILCGIAAGFVTGLLQTKLRVPSILAGIITMTGLFSINLMVLQDKSTVTLSRTTETIYTFWENLFGNKNAANIFVAAAVSIIVCIFYVLFLRTRLGLSIRATGDNRDMVSASSINPNFTIIVGLAIANGVTALAGALIAQYQHFYENNMGIGTVVIGLASLMIGEIVIGRGGIARCVCGTIIGSVIYRLIIAFALNMNISPSNLKLVTAIIVAAAVSFPALKEIFTPYRLKRKTAKQAAKLKEEGAEDAENK